MEPIAVILGFCAILSFVAYKSNFFGLKLLAGMSWFGFVIWWKDAPIAEIIQGSPTHTAIMVIAIGFGLMIVLSGLGRGISKKQRTMNGNFEIQSEGEFQLQTPNWIKNVFSNQEEKPEMKRIARENKLLNYEDRLDRAYKLGKYNNKRR